MKMFSKEGVEMVDVKSIKRDGEQLVIKGKVMGAMATTILDRLMHRCAMLEFEGKSYRLKEAATRIAINPESS